MDNNEFGKFASSKELLRAYTELEKDYTKKCQKLAELLRKIENAEILCNAENAEILCDKSEHSVKNAQNDSAKTEFWQNESFENGSGIIANKDAFCNSTTCICEPLKNDDATAVDDNSEHCRGANETDKKPIYLSPMFGFFAKEFFDSSVIAAAFEKEILDLVATDDEISCLPNALEAAAERVVGKHIMQPVFCDKFVEVLCSLPQIKQKVIDLYVESVRSRNLPPATVRFRSVAATTKAKFDSIAEASKHLLSRL